MNQTSNNPVNRLAVATINAFTNANAQLRMFVTRAELQAELQKFAELHGAGGTVVTVVALPSSVPATNLSLEDLVGDVTRVVENQELIEEGHNTLNGEVEVLHLQGNHNAQQIQTLSDELKASKDAEKALDEANDDLMSPPTSPTANSSSSGGSNRGSPVKTAKGLGANRHVNCTEQSKSANKEYQKGRSEKARDKNREREAAAQDAREKENVRTVRNFAAQAEGQKKAEHRSSEKFAASKAESKMLQNRAHTATKPVEVPTSIAGGSSIGYQQTGVSDPFFKHFISFNFKSFSL